MNVNWGDKNYTTSLSRFIILVCISTWALMSIYHQYLQSVTSSLFSIKISFIILLCELFYGSFSTTEGVAGKQNEWTGMKRTNSGFIKWTSSSPICLVQITVNMSTQRQSTMLWYRGSFQWYSTNMRIGNKPPRMTFHRQYHSSIAEQQTR